MKIIVRLRSSKKIPERPLLLQYRRDAVAHRLLLSEGIILLSLWSPNDIPERAGARTAMLNDLDPRFLGNSSPQTVNRSFTKSVFITTSPWKKA
jgi:hypothetical protein